MTRRGRGAGGHAGIVSKKILPSSGEFATFRGVGKTGIVEGLAQLLAEGKLPDALGRPAVVEISLTSLVGRNEAVS